MGQVFVAVALLLFGNWLGFWIRLPGEWQTPLWPPVGTAVALLWLFPLRRAWIVAVSLVGVEVFWALVVRESENPWTWPLGYALSSCAGLLAATWILRALLRQRIDFGQYRHVLPFLTLNALAGPAVAGALGAFVLVQGQPALSWLPEAETWALGDSLSVLIVTPLLLGWLWPRPAMRGAGSTARRLEEGLVYAFLVALASLTLLRSEPPVLSLFEVPHVTVPFLLLAALRFDTRTVATALAISAGFLIYQAKHGEGMFFEASGGSAQGAMISLQLYLGVISAASLLLSCFVLQTRRTEAVLQRRVKELSETRGALDESERRLDQLAIHIDTVLWMLDPIAQKFLYVSPAFERVWGGSVKELEEDSGAWLKCVHPDDRERIAASWDGGRKNDRTDSWAQEFRVVRPDGLVIHVRDRVFPLLNEKGEAIRYVGQCVDVTQDVQTERRRVALEGQLHEAQKMESVGQLAAGVAHDVNNVLTVIQGHAELIAQESESLSVGVRPSLLALDDAVGQAAEITRSLLTFSRRSETRREPVDLRESIERTASFIERTLPARVSFERRYAQEAGPWVLADETQLQQVLLNLAINARDSMPDGGALTIEVGPAIPNGLEDLTAREGAADTCDSHTVQIGVSDTGSGMSLEVQRRIFEPFFTTKDRDRGTGLGLAVVRGIVREHGGGIDVESAPGEGTVFTVEFPCSTTQPAPSASERARAEFPRGAGQPVLLVEDDPGVRFILAMQLKRLGYEVIEAHDGEEMKRAVRAAPGFHQLIVTDVDLPRLSGPDALRQLRAKGDRTPALIVTGTNDARVQDLQDNAHGVSTELLSKPFPLADLAEAVRRLMRS